MQRKAERPGQTGGGASQASSPTRIALLLVPSATEGVPPGIGRTIGSHRIK
jgi:hypothetical protein